jgi:hypothetical protein
LFPNSDLRASPVGMSTVVRKCCCAPWCDRHRHISVLLPTDMPGLRVDKVWVLCNSHFMFDSEFERHMDCELLAKYDFTINDVDGSDHSRVLKYEHLPAPQGNPMKAWVVVYWDDRVQGAQEGAREPDIQVYDPKTGTGAHLYLSWLTMCVALRWSKRGSRSK